MTEPISLRPRARRLPVKIPISRSTIPVFLESQIMNLSKGGVFIRSDIVFPLGSEIDFEFSLPGSSRAVRAVGVVVWTRPRRKGEKHFLPEHPPGMGVQFRTIHSEDLDFLMEQLERLLKNTAEL